MSETEDWSNYENILREHEQKLEAIKYKKFTELIGDFVEQNTICIHDEVMYNNITEKGKRPLDENLQKLFSYVKKL